MVGIMNLTNWADRASSLLNSAISSSEAPSKILLNSATSSGEAPSKILLNSATSSGEAPSKMKQLRQLRELLLHLDSSLLPNFIPQLSAALQADRASPVRNYLAELIGVIGSKHTEFVPAMVPTLISLLKDETPAVARQAIATGTILFRLVLEKVVVDKLDDSLKSCWEWMLNFKDSVLPIVIQSENDGVRLLAMKFVEAMVLLYTPDPNGDLQGFNISWVRRDHPLLDVANLSMEASQSLSLLLDQLRFPNVRSLSNSMITVLTNSLSAIAQRRPSFYGCIVPVLLDLYPASLVIQGVQVPGAHQALKNALLACWKCTHPSAEPWRPRLIGALKAMDAGGLIEEAYGLNNISEGIDLTTAVHPVIGCKRRFVDDNDDAISQKRIRSSEKPLQTDNGSTQNNLLIGSFASTWEDNSGSIQQLVDTIGALVAQGEKASNSLKILTSSISPDLLVEVVMSNLRHLPPTCPKAERGEAWKSLSVVQPSHTISDNFLLSTAVPLIASRLNVQPTASHNIVEESCRYEVDKAIKAGTSCISYTITNSVAVIPTTNQASISINPTEKQKDISTNEMQGVEQERSITFRSTLPLNVSSFSCMPTFNSKTFSPIIAVVDESRESLTTSPISSIYITDEQKDQHLKAAFVRILKAYEQVAVSDGSDIHFSLLANFGIDFSSVLDSWGLLQDHVMCNYVNHEGHELILRVLYKLFQKIEQDKDLLTSRAATSVYESFLLIVAKALRNTFSASDKSLGKLLTEVPYLSESVLKLVECLCSPVENGKDDNSFQNGDRVTQGLSIVWNLILLRPSNRDRCLQIALESAVHHREEVRTKAIRLVANKLFPVASISKKIEDFANEKLHSAVNIIQMDLDDDGSVPGSESSFSKAHRCMSLYFALCTKKQSLLRRIFAIYQTLPKVSKEAVHSQVPVLVHTIRSSHELFDIIAAPPVGSEDLLIQVLQTLTDAAVPSQNLILSIKRLCESRPKDVHVLIPVTQFLSKDEVISIFPQFVNLPLNKFQAAVTRILQGTIQTGSSLTPAEVLIAIHDIDIQRDGVPLKKVIDACSACFEQQGVFTEQVLAKVLNKLVEQIPLPLLFMRTVIQAIALYPALVDFVMEILSKLVRKQIWKFPKLWVGFLKCILQTMPQSFSVLLKLPFEQLEIALNQNPILRAPLVEHANLPNIRSSLPQSTLLVLGLVNDIRASSGQSQAQRSHSQDADTGNFAADIAMEKTLETMAVS